MPRTDEQRAADDQLTVAIQKAMDAYGVSSTNGTLGDYTVTFVEVQIDDDGDLDWEYGRLVRDGSMAPHNLAGLLLSGADDDDFRD